LFCMAAGAWAKPNCCAEFCKGKPHVFYAAKECDDAEQLRDFSQQILKGNEAARFVSVFDNWEKAFSAVLTLETDCKKLLVLDEFPYMVNGKRAIPSILQNLWDAVLSRENVMLILCGSAMSFIEKELLAEKNPLYGRATGILKLGEMDFYEACQFFPTYSAQDKVLTYAILGGIPYYLKQFDGTQSLETNIKQNILTRGCILYNEVEFLMHRELREPALYNSLISAIALGATQLNEIHQKTQIEKTKINVYLKNLIELHVLKREFPLSEPVKQQANIQRGLYALADNYFRFWYRFLFPNMSELEAGDTDGIYDFVIRPHLDEFASKAFEDICIRYLRAKNRQGALPFRFSRIGRYWDKNTEIDILAFDSGGNAVLAGECKYRNKLFDKRDSDKLRRKSLPCSDDTAIHYVAFSKSGFAEGLPSDMLCVSAEELV